MFLSFSFFFSFLFFRLLSGFGGFFSVSSVFEGARGGDKRMARNSHHLFQTKAPIWGLVVVFVVLVLSLVFFSSGWSAKTERPPSCSIKSNTRGLFSDFVSSPRIIVTGGAGFIGSHLVAELVQLYSVDQVVVIDSLVRGKLENLEEIKDRSQLTVCETNLEDPLNAKKYVKGADIVFHLSDGNDCLSEVFQSTILSNKNVLNAAIESGAKRYFYTETTCNFPKRSQMPMPEQSSSGESQLWEETEAARVAAQDGKIDVGVLRFYNVYGDHTEFAEPTSQLLPALIYRALSGGNRKGDLLVGGHSGDFLHVSDAVSALLALLRVNSPIPFHQTIQIGSGERVRILELAEYISEIAFSDFGIQYHNRRLKVLPEWSKKPTVNSDQIADNQAAKNLLGWEPKVTWKAGVKMLVYWISDQMDFLPFLPLLKPSYAYYEIPSTPKFCAFWYEKPSTSSYSYYYEIFSAIEKHPAVSLFSNLRRSFCVDQDELVIILPSNIMTKEEPIANAVKDIQRKVRDLNFKKKVIFAVFLNKVYKELQIKIDLLLPLLNIHNSTVLVFSWSPHAITWKRTRIPRQTHSRMFFYFLPFAVNLHQFDLVSENQ